MDESKCSTSTWAAMVSQLPDPRARRGRRYAWASLVVLVCAAVASGQQTGAAMAQWVAEHAVEWQQWVPSTQGRVPSAATLRRVLRHLDAPVLEACLAAWTTAQQPKPRPARRGRQRQAGLRAVALDGKALRGTYAHGAPLHLVSLVTHERVQVLGQLAVADKSNEIPAGRTLLRGRDWHGWVVTLDALQTQRATAELILAHGGHYLMVVKANQPDLCAMLQEWFAEPAWADEGEAQVTTSDKGHGRFERRTLTRRVFSAREAADWPGARQALRRVCWRRDLATGREAQALTYAVTSLAPAQASAAQLEAWWRGHWHIENQLHYVRDVTCREDAGQAHVGATAHILAALRNGLLSLLRRLGWTNMAAGFRHVAASGAHVFTVLGCPVPATCM